LRIAFIIGLILAPLTGSFVGYALAEPQMPASWVTTVGGGLLVGFGTRQGGGCTSGHGVCGGTYRTAVRSGARSWPSSYVAAHRAPQGDRLRGGLELANVVLESAHLKCGANSLGFRDILAPETFRG